MSGYHMTPEEFRQYGKQVVDWIADYQKWVETYPVMSQTAAGEIRNRLPESPPCKGESISEMLDDMESVIMPGIMHWQSPNFFGYFPCNGSGPGILGDLLSTGLNVQGMMWSTSPACTELEGLVLDWMVDMLALPESFKSSNGGGGVIQDSASSASLCALIAARERATEGQSNTQGVDASLVGYASVESHSSVEKAFRIIGIGSDRMRRIKTDENFAMDVSDLESQIELDLAKGLKPFAVCATIGTTASNGLDPLRRIAEICQRDGIWLHVDAAMLGTAALCEEYRYIHDGLEFADSYCFNPHKWMFTNFDCNCFYVADRYALTRAMSIHPEYLHDHASESDDALDYRNWQIPLGRRFRALKLWFVIRHYGVEGLQHHVREHVAIAQKFAAWVKEDPEFELLAPHPFNLVCFAHRKGDAFTRRLLDELNRSGKLFMSHAVLAGTFAIRMCVGQTHTEERHVRNAWKRIHTTAEQLDRNQIDG